MSRGLQASLFPIKIPSKSIYAKAHAADPVHSLRWNSLRHQTLETAFCHFNKVPIPWGDPREPRGSQGAQRNPRDPRDPRDPRAPSAPLGGWAHGALWGYSEAIPNGKSFRVEGNFEWKAIPKKSRNIWCLSPIGNKEHSGARARFVRCI